MVEELFQKLIDDFFIVDKFALNAETDDILKARQELFRRVVFICIAIADELLAHAFLAFDAIDHAQRIIAARQELPLKKFFDFLRDELIDILLLAVKLKHRVDIFKNL